MLYSRALPISQKWYHFLTRWQLCLNWLFPAKIPSYIPPVPKSYHSMQAERRRRLGLAQENPGPSVAIITPTKVSMYFQHTFTLQEWNLQAHSWFLTHFLSAGKTCWTCCDIRTTERLPANSEDESQGKMFPCRYYFWSIMLLET